MRPGRPSSLSDLAGTIYVHFQQSEQQSDLERTIDLLDEALAHEVILIPDRAGSIRGLAIAINARLKVVNNSSDLDKAT